LEAQESLQEQVIHLGLIKGALIHTLNRRAGVGNKKQHEDMTRVDFVKAPVNTCLFEVFLNQLYEPFIGVDVNEILSYLVRRDRGVNERLAASRLARSGVLAAGARAGERGWTAGRSQILV